MNRFNNLILCCNIALFSLITLPRESSLVATDQCEFCCTRLFGSSNGIINVRESTSVLHTVSYIVRCLMSSDEVVIVSDGSSSSPIWLHDEDHSKKGVCSYAENVPVSHIAATDFLQDSGGSYFHKLVPTYDPATMAKRTNFVFVPHSTEQMVSLVRKVEQELHHHAGKFFWQPYIIFLWPDIQQALINVNCTGKSCHIPYGEKLLHSWFENYKPHFKVDSGVFFFFIVQKGISKRSMTNLYLSIWECYSLKRRFIIQEIRQLKAFKLKPNLPQVKCTSNASSVLSWMEKVNSYVFVERFLRRDNFMRVPVTASVMLSTDTDEWITVKRNESGGVSLESGSSVDIYKDMQIMMNFSEEVLLENGIQYLAYRNMSNSTDPPNSIIADILINQKSATPVRAQLYSFLQPTYTGIYEAFFRQPSVNAIRNIVSAPFTISLWAVTLGIWMLIVGCLYFWGYLVKRKWLLSHGSDQEFLQEIGMWAIAAMTQKSSNVSPSSSNFKFIYYIGSIMALVCYVAYSAVIVSFFTVKTVPVKSFNDLLEYDYKFTVHEESEATVSLLREMIILNQLNQGIIKITTEQEITHLKEQNYALLSYPDLFYKTADQQNYTENFICSKVYSLAVGNTPYKSAMSVGKGSQLRETFSAKLLVIMERGLNYRYMKAYDDNKAINCQKQNYNHAQERSEFDPVHFTDVFTTFLVIYIGWFLAVFIFFSERVFKRRRAIKYKLTFMIQ